MGLIGIVLPFTGYKMNHWCHASRSKSFNVGKGYFWDQWSILPAENKEKLHYNKKKIKNKELEKMSTDIQYLLHSEKLGMSCIFFQVFGNNYNLKQYLSYIYYFLSF